MSVQPRLVFIGDSPIAMFGGKVTDRAGEEWPERYCPIGPTAIDEDGRVWSQCIDRATFGKPPTSVVWKRVPMEFVE